MTVLVSKVDHSRIDSNNHQIQIIAKMEILQFIYLFILTYLYSKAYRQNCHSKISEFENNNKNKN
jgi:hypothetical protein